MSRGPDPEGKWPREVGATERVAGRLVGRRQPLVGTLAILSVALVLAALVVLPNFIGMPSATPSPTPDSSDTAVHSPSVTTPATMAPTGGPSAEPNPSAVIAPIVVDRQGVPAALYDTYWMALGQVGQVGTTARIVIPADEVTLGADAGWVASYGVDPNTLEPLLSPNGATIIVRDVRTGDTLRSIVTGVQVSYGLISGSILLWIGKTVPLDEQEGIDAGVWAVDLADSASTPYAIIPPTDLTTMYGPNASRSRPRLTDLGRAIVTTVVGDLAKATQVIDVPTLALRATILDETVYEVANGFILVRRPDGLALLDIAYGRVVGPLLKADETYRAAVGEREIFVQYGRAGSGVHLAAISLDSGEARDLLVQPPGTRTTFMSRDLSAPNLLVLLNDDWEVDSQGNAYVQVALLDPATGDLQQNAFTIGAP